MPNIDEQTASFEPQMSPVESPARETRETRRGNSQTERFTRIESDKPDTAEPHPGVSISRSGTRILTRLSPEEYHNQNRETILFSGEPRRLSLAEFKEWMPLLPPNSDIVALILAIDSVVAGMSSLVESRETLDYYANQVLTHNCPPTQRHLLNRALHLSTWAERRQLILDNKCSPDYFAALEKEMSNIPSEHISMAEKVQRVISLSDRHEAVSRTIGRDPLSVDRVVDELFAIFDINTVLLLQQAWTNSRPRWSFTTFIDEAYRWATLIDQRQTTNTRRTVVMTVDPIENHGSLKDEIHELKVFMTQLTERAKRSLPDDFDEPRKENKINMVTARRMPRQLECTRCSRTGHVARDCRTNIPIGNNKFNGNTTSHCFNCGDPGHTRPQCRYQEPVCFQCKQANHSIAFCPQVKPRSMINTDSKNRGWNNQITESVNAPNDNTKATICRLCSQAGHAIKTCPQFQGNNGSNNHLCPYCNLSGHVITECPEFVQYRQNNPEGARNLAKKLGF